jgi:DNA recombination protein RmuC
MAAYYILAALCALLGLGLGFFVAGTNHRKALEPLKGQIAEGEKALAVSHERERSFQNQLVESKSRYKELETVYKVALRENSGLKELIREEKTRLSEREGKIRDLKLQFEEQKRGLKEEFRNLSQEILKEKEEALKKENTEGITHLISPLKIQIENFQKRVNEVNTEQTRNSAQLFGQIKNLNQMNENLRGEAENLAKALKNDKKTLGNWGEIQVEMLLEESGLTKEREYRREENFKNREGENRRPDFVIYLPEKKHIIIDSKVSLNAYVNAVNAPSAEEQNTAMAEHVRCIHAHIENLSSKDYTSLVGMNSPDFVFMFMPIESAYLAAFEHDPSLFDFAYKRKIAVVTPNTLLPILRTVSSLWNIEKQNQSTRQIAASAGKVYDKLEVFSRKFLDIEKSITSLSVKYSEAQKTLLGPRSLVNLVESFRELGIKVNKELPTEYGEPVLIKNESEE